MTWPNFVFYCLMKCILSKAYYLKNLQVPYLDLLILEISVINWMSFCNLLRTTVKDRPLAKAMLVFMVKDYLTTYHYPILSFQFCQSKEVIYSFVVESHWGG